MSQRNIENYFRKSNANNTSILSDSDSDSNDSFNVNRCISGSADLSYYEDHFNRKVELQKLVKVVVNDGKISECWKYFGDLY